MKYLAFDIEAANGYKLYSICSIGVVIADENFRIEHSENIWINPKCKYNLNGTRTNVEIDLKLDKELLEASPDFPAVYPRIKELLQNKDYVVVGHAVDSDVRMLNAACKHFGLPPLKFQFVCSQLLYRLFKGEKEVKALNKIAAELGLEFSQHNSESDAWMSMQTLAYLTNETHKSVDELMNLYSVRRGETENFVLSRPLCLSEQVSKKKVTQKTLNKLRAFARGVKPVSHTLAGKTFAIARSLELSENAPKIIKIIYSCGGKWSAHLAKSNFYVCSDEKYEVDVLRERRVAELEKENLTTEITVETLLNMAKGD